MEDGLRFVLPGRAYTQTEKGNTQYFFVYTIKIQMNDGWLNGEIPVALQVRASVHSQYRAWTEWHD